MWGMCEDKYELYKNGDTTYRVQHYSDEFNMDNIASMTWFLDFLEIIDKEIIEYDGTQVVLKIKDKYFQVDSSGFGDFFSHQFDVIDITSEYTN